MEQNTQDIIKSRLTELPPELRDAITAADLPAKFDAISKKFSLRIDQSGNLQTETVLVMLGLESRDDFMQNLVTNVELSRELAKSVAEEVGTQIFNSIRSSLQKMEQESEDADAATNEKPESENMDQASLIKGIEDPATQTVGSVNVLNASATPLKPLSPSDLVDHLLNAPTASANETVEKAAPAPTSKPIPSVDPYREPIE